MSNNLTIATGGPAPSLNGGKHARPRLSGASPAGARRVAVAKLPPAPRWVRLMAAMIPRMPAGRYRLLNRLRMRRAPFLASMPVENGRCSFACDLRDSISREVCFTGRYEAQETAVVRGILRPGMTFVDVGANWGYFTLHGARLVGRSGRVISLEPEPRLFELLEGNLFRNHLDQAIPLQVAAAAETGMLTLAGFEEGSDNWGVSRVVEDRAGGPATCGVAARALDAILDELGVDRVDLVKMDIEGAEDFALRGMSGGLAARRYRRILLELHPWIFAERGRTPLQVCEPLTRNGYRAWRIDFSPSATRRAAYASSIKLQSFLRPMIDLREALDAWPHLLWLAPGIEEPC